MMNKNERPYFTNRFWIKQYNESDFNIDATEEQYLEIKKERSTTFTRSKNVEKEAKSLYYCSNCQLSFEKRFNKERHELLCFKSKKNIGIQTNDQFYKALTIDKRDEFEISNDVENNIPEAILNLKKIDGEILCLTTIKKRPDGDRPQNRYLNTRELRNKYPRILLDYYEKRLRFKE